MISIRNVSYQIGSTMILSDISLEIPKGKVTALIGPNGAGKSTLLSLIARLERLQSGTVRVGNLLVGECSNRELAQHLSILPQTLDQAPRLSVRELVSFGRYPYHQGRPQAEDNRAVDHALTVFGLADLAQRPLDALSGGQRQRVQIAMNFAQDTEYMLLDEPLNNLDIAGARSLMALLCDVSERHSKTIVIVLHDINYASRYADHIVAMQNGTIMAEGTPSEIVNADLLRDVFQTNAEIMHVDGVPIVLV